MNANDKYTTGASGQEHSGSDSRTGDKAGDGGKIAMHATEAATTSAKRKLQDAGDAVREAVSDTKEAAADAVEDGRSRVGEVLRKAQDTAQGAKDAIVSGAGATMATVRDVAVEKADEARESLSDVGERLAATLQRASAEGDGDALKSRVLTSVSQGLTTASDALRQRSVSDLTSDVKELAKRHPGAFMAAAAVVGFAAARFVRSSSKRRHDHDQGPQV